MNKREFLKTSGALLTGTALSRAIAAAQTSDMQKNWAGNLRYHAQKQLFPNTVDELREAVRANPQVKALGSRHSFSAIADSNHVQISVKNMQEMHIDRDAKTVTVGAGVAYGKLAPYLQQHGFALHNLASLPHISVAGACATATHGSGIRNGNLSTAVTRMEFITADGAVLTLDQAKDGDRFKGAVVGLGAFGVATRVTLSLLEDYRVQQVVYQNLPLTQLERHFEEIFSSGYSVSLFTDWQNHRATQVWIKSQVDEDAPAKPSMEFFGAKLSRVKLHPLDGHSAENCTEQLGVPGPWYERLPHFRMDFTPSSGEELQSEYFVPRDRGYEAILAVEELRDEITPHLFITELRTVAADDLWMSMAYQRPSLALHFTWKPEWPAVQKLLPKIEAKLAPFQARPHWGKLFTVEPAVLQSRYPKLNDFRALVKQYDPQGKFTNEYLRRNVLAS